MAEGKPSKVGRQRWGRVRALPLPAHFCPSQSFDVRDWKWNVNTPKQQREWLKEFPPEMNIAPPPFPFDKLPAWLPANVAPRGKDILGRFKDGNVCVVRYAQRTAGVDRKRWVVQLTGSTSYFPLLDLVAWAQIPPYPEAGT